MSNLFFNQVKDFDESLNKCIFDIVKLKMKPYVSAKNSYNLYHGKSFGNSFSSCDSELKPLSVEIIVDYEYIREYKIEEMFNFIQNFSDGIHKKQVSELYKTIGEVCEKSGQTIDSRESEKSIGDLFLEMINKVEFSINEEGQIEFPTLHLHPDMLEKLKNDPEMNTVEFQTKLEELKTKKAEMTITKEQERLLKFKGISFE